MRILLIEDNNDIAARIMDGFRNLEHQLERAFDGKEGLFLATTESFDVLLVESNLPHTDGSTLIKTLRSANIDTPVLIMTAQQQLDDRIAGLKNAGDDYLIRPFAFVELQARLESLWRRHQQAFNQQTLLSVADLEVDLSDRKVSRAGQSISLGSREFRLLAYLLKHKGQLVTPSMILESVWDASFATKTNVIDQYVSRLRLKIDKGFSRPILNTMQGAGYMIKDDD